MAMHKSEELPTVALTFFKQIEQLGIPINATSVNLVNESTESYQLYFANEKDIGIASELAIKDFWFAKESFRQLKKGVKEFTVDCEGVKLQGWIDFVKKEVSLERGLRLEKAKLKKGYIHTVQFHDLSHTIFTSIAPFSETTLKVLKRMTKIFGMSYTRFLDLQKAEAQAREAQIEAAMERIRSRAIAMRSSDELKEVIIEMRRQIDMLGQLDLEASVIHLYTDGAKMFESFAAVRPPGESGEIVIANILFPVDAMRQIEYMIEMYHSDQQEYTIEFDKKRAEEWQEVMVRHAPMIAARRVGFVANRRTSDNPEYWNFADFSHGSLLLVTHSPASNDTQEVLRKAAQVFDQAYIRFLDLQTAEAQAREAQIEAALERVRAASMAMHTSEDIPNVALVFVNQIEALGLSIFGTSINIVSQKNPEIFTSYNADNWTAEEGKKDLTIMPDIPMNAVYALRKGYEEIKKGNTDFTIEAEGEHLKEIIELIKNNQSELGAKYIEEAGIDKFYFNISVFHGLSSIQFTELAPISEDRRRIYRRFADAFGLAYTRFLDLQKAEAQAREAQIEAALERVRAASMAMHNSEELPSVAEVLVNQMTS